jgi:hypothetical protein
MEEQHSPIEYPPEESASNPDASQQTSEGISSDSAAAASVTKPLPEALPANHAPTLADSSHPQEVIDRSPENHPSTQQSWHTLTRRQVLIGAGVVVGVAAIGTGTTLALISSSSSNPSSSSSSSTGSVPTVGLPPPQTPVSEDTLHAWRTKRLTAKPSQRFQHQRGTALVPLGVVEPTYPNPYNPYIIHLQGYVLGGVLVARTQFFLYLGLESLDGSQFVAKVRVGPVDQTSKTFGLLVAQQSTDAIEGGPGKSEGSSGVSGYLLFTPQYRLSHRRAGDCHCRAAAGGCDSLLFRPLESIAQLAHLGSAAFSSGALLWQGAGLVPASRHISQACARRVYQAA